MVAFCVGRYAPPRDAPAETGACLVDACGPPIPDTAGRPRRHWWPDSAALGFDGAAVAGRGIGRVGAGDGGISNRKICDASTLRSVPIRVK